MTVLEFKYEVCALLNRAPSSLLVNGQDLVVNTMNRARSSAQRRLDFAFLRRYVEVRNSQDLYLLDTETLVGSINVKNAFLRFNNGSILPVEYSSTDSFLARLGRRLEYDPQGRIPTSGNPYYQMNPTKPVVYKTVGDGASTGAWYKLWANDTQLSASVLDGSTKIVLDGYADDGAFSLSQTINMIYNGSPGAKGPLEIGSNTPGVGYIISIPQSGIFKDNIFFTSLSESVFVWFSENNGAVGGPHWALSNYLGRMDYTWEAPPGVDSLGSIITWTPSGFVSAGVLTSSGYGQSEVDSSSTNDIWMDDCGEWLQLYVLQYLQTHFIKDQTRWPVTQKMVDTAWEAVVTWNESKGAGEFQYDLD